MEKKKGRGHIEREIFDVKKNYIIKMDILWNVYIFDG